MRITLLGPVEARTDHGSPIDLGGARLRMVLARLALAAGRPVSPATLLDDLWGEQVPAGAGSALQAAVSRLRKALGSAAAVELTAAGYRLPLGPEDVDVHRFEELTARGRRELAAGRDREAAPLLAAALRLWRGAALADVRDAPFAGPCATRLQELRAAAAEDRFAAELRLGRHTEVLPELGAAGAEHPLSERLAELRMRALAATGHRPQALEVYARLRRGLDRELGVAPAARLQELQLALLRGEPQPPADRTADHPAGDHPPADRTAADRPTGDGARPAARPTAAPGRLPGRLAGFVGREDELRDLAALLATSRLVSIVGAGGSGKTRLSLEAAARERTHRLGRLWFVPLAGVAAPEHLADAVLAALGAPDRTADGGAPHRPAGRTAPTDRTTPADRIPDRIADRIADLLGADEAVLLLDNCEHLVEATAELADRLLDRSRRLRVLTTTREPLAITGERLLHLGPLPVPTGNPAPAEAVQAASVRLFVDRATAVRPDFVLDGSTVGAVVEICRQLDGMPLALELAAGRLRAMDVHRIAERLGDRFRLLTSGSRTAPPRQRTLRAVVEWSWDLLDDAERALAGRLSVFPGGATLPALEAVCADGALPAGDVLYVLTSLVEKSLVGVGPGPEPRYRMPATERAYAAGRHAATGPDLTGRFADHFLALAEQHAPLLRTARREEAVRVLDAEHDNLVHALRTAVDTRDTERALRLLGALLPYWGLRGMDGQAELFTARLLGAGAGAGADTDADAGAPLPPAGPPRPAPRCPAGTGWATGRPRARHRVR